MIRIMQNKRFGWFSFGTWGIDLLGLIGSLIFYSVKDDNIYKILCANKFLLIFLFLFVIGVISSYCYIYSSKKDVILTKEEIMDCITKTINEKTQIKIDESVVSRVEAKLEDIQKQHSVFETTLYEKLENVFFTKNSNMKFLQDMAASISNKDNAWTNEQIEIFLKCMESICTMMKKE